MPVTQTSDWLVIGVSDTGPGIAPEDVARSSIGFTKAPRSQGSGLGLAIARQLVEAHGGDDRR